MSEDCVQSKAVEHQAVQCNAVELETVSSKAVEHQAVEHQAVQTEDSVASVQGKNRQTWTQILQSCHRGTLVFKL